MFSRAIERDQRHEMGSWIILPEVVVPRNSFKAEKTKRKRQK